MTATNTSNAEAALRDRLRDVEAQLAAVNTAIQNFQVHITGNDFHNLREVGLVSGEFGKLPRPRRRQLEECQLRLIQKQELLTRLLDPEAEFSPGEYDHLARKAMRKILPVVQEIPA